MARPLPSAPKDNVYKFKCNVIKWAFECIPQHDKVNGWGFPLLFSKYTKRRVWCIDALNIWLNSNWITNRMPRIEFTDVIYSNVSSFFFRLIHILPVATTTLLHTDYFTFHSGVSPLCCAMQCSSRYFLYQTARCTVRCHFFFRDIKFHIQSIRVHQTNNSGDEKTNDSRHANDSQTRKTNKICKHLRFDHANVQNPLFSTGGSGQNEKIIHCNAWHCNVWHRLNVSYPQQIGRYAMWMKRKRGIFRGGPNFSTFIPIGQNPFNKEPNENLFAT